jgi:hypothetical protein
MRYGGRGCDGNKPGVRGDSMSPEKIKMDSIIIREMQYSINVYEIGMKRE